MLEWTLDYATAPVMLFGTFARKIKGISHGLPDSLRRWRQQVGMHGRLPHKRDLLRPWQ
jgi:hypothetical protein